MELRFPLAGLHQGYSTEAQPELTAFKLQNVRPYDPLSNRARGGQRPGLDKMYSQQIGGAANPIVWMGSITTVD